MKIKPFTIDHNGLVQLALINSYSGESIVITEPCDRKEKAKQEAIEILSNLLLRIQAL